MRHIRVLICPVDAGTPDLMSAAGDSPRRPGGVEAGDRHDHSPAPAVRAVGGD